MGNRVLHWNKLEKDSELIHVLSFAFQTLKTFFYNVLLELGGLPHVLPLAVHLEWLGTPSWHLGVLRASVWTMPPHSDPLKVMGGWVGWGGVVVAHEILVTSPEAKFLFSLFGAFWGFGLWTGPWPRACQKWQNLKHLSSLLGQAWRRPLTRKLKE